MSDSSGTLATLRRMNTCDVLASEIATELRTEWQTGWSFASNDEDGIERYRVAGRCAGRLIGRKFRTLRVDRDRGATTQAIVVVTDEPDEAERRRLDERAAIAIRAMAPRDRSRDRRPAPRPRLRNPLTLARHSSASVRASLADAARSRRGLNTAPRSPPRSGEHRRTRCLCSCGALRERGGSWLGERLTWGDACRVLRERVAPGLLRWPLRARSSRSARGWFVRSSWLHLHSRSARAARSPPHFMRFCTSRWLVGGA